MLNDFFTFALAQQADIVDDVMQARIAIECQAVRLACERANMPISKLAAALARIVETIDDAEPAAWPISNSIALSSWHRKSETLTVLHDSLSRHPDALPSQPPRAGSGVRLHEDLPDRRPSPHLRRHRRRATLSVPKGSCAEHFAIGDEYRRRAAIGECDSPERLS